jgi:hypothetical protein
MRRHGIEGIPELDAVCMQGLYPVYVERSRHDDAKGRYEMKA